jgi:acyl carrier protein
VLAAAPEERQGKIQAYLAEALAKLLGVSAATLTAQSTGNLSLDSLMAMELRHVLRRDIEVDLPVMQILRTPSISSMAKMLTELMMEKVS